MSIGTSPQLEIEDPQRYFGVPTKALSDRWLTTRGPEARRVTFRPQDHVLRNALDEGRFLVEYGDLILYHDRARKREMGRVTLSEQVVDILATRSAILGGAWLVFAAPDIVDNLWLRIAEDTKEGNLGDESSCSTKGWQNKRRKCDYIIKAHTPDYLNGRDVERVGERLFSSHPVPARFFYKPDLYLKLGITSEKSTVPDIRPVRYTSLDIEV
ncbi:MAG TPA: putative phosphothreonine lyase domain-containing protein [archaeon]|nr:putative phosphothreonine lyase domain-containing protein [archaeon]